MRQYQINIILIICFIYGLLPANSQHRFALELDGGVQSGLLFQSDIVNSLPGYGASGGINYMYFIRPKWGIETGVLYGYSQSKITIDDGVTLSTNELDDTTSGFEFRVIPLGYQEQLTLQYLAIPLKLTYDSAFNNSEANLGFYFSAGAKYILPLNAKSNVSVNEIQLQGYYPNYDVLIDDLPQHGFGKINDLSDTVVSDFKNTIALNVDMGISFKISKLRLYLGAYGDWGFSDFNNSNQKSSTLMTYNPKGLPNQMSVSVSGLKAVKTVRFLSVGLQIKIPLFFSQADNRSLKRAGCMYSY